MTWDAWIQRVNGIIGETLAAANATLRRLQWEPPGPEDMVKVVRFCDGAMRVCHSRMNDSQFCEKPASYSPAVLGEFDPDVVNRNAPPPWRTGFGAEMHYNEQERRWEVKALCFQPEDERELAAAGKNPYMEHPDVRLALDTRYGDHGVPVRAGASGDVYRP